MKTLGRALRPALVAAASLLALGCPGPGNELPDAGMIYPPGGGGGGNNQPTHASAVIGPGGGELKLRDVTLTVPANALGQDTEISIDVRQPTLTGLTALSTAFEFSPSGLAFAAPATLTFTLTSADPEAKVYRGETLQSPPALVPGAVVSGTQVTADISGFSYYVVAKTGGLSFFEIDGARYSPHPVSSGKIAGYSHSVLGELDVTDGTQSAGHVWYDSNYCVTFRSNGSGILDAKGGLNASLSNFPHVRVDWLPGSDSITWYSPTHRSPAGEDILDPNYVRQSDFHHFNWGVRLNEDGGVYQNWSGDYEYGFVWAEGSKPFFTKLSWDPEAGGPGGFSRLTTTPPEKQHFCAFIELKGLHAGDSTMRCISTPVQNQGIPAMEKACYWGGNLNDSYVVETDAGIPLEAGQFKDGRPFGPWAFYKAGGGMRAEGSFNEHGLRSGEWKVYDSNGKLDELAQYRGGLMPSPVGYYDMLEGFYQDWHVDWISGAHFLKTDGSHFEGKRKDWWDEYDKQGCLVRATQYDHTSQEPTGWETCYPLGDGGQTCIQHTESYRMRTISYNRPSCYAHYISDVLWNRDGTIISETCYDLTGTCTDPVKGAARTSCPSVSCQ